MLRDVRECNPFEENMQHTPRWTEIAVRLSEAKGKVFSARSVRDRTDLLLAQYADRYRRSLRREKKPSWKAGRNTLRVCRKKNEA
ncbi:hypothetical protein HPB48_003651 [Haemaphysalis longicornis]|uniref:Uncharacterized protein n=1 Tax=Haemaphysalis longicornis TaxID=44386 RepID=A0A9J6FJ74_HAELO|nr:hypothetical protein HPB48_003651 [Haemaphysalis longicornis]